MAESAMFTSLLNLGIGGAALGCMTLIVRWFLSGLAEMRDRHEAAMLERETALRTLEREVRTEILSQLGRNTQIMERVMVHMDRH